MGIDSPSQVSKVGLTEHADLGLLGVGGTVVVGDHALVAAGVGVGDVGQVERGGGQGDPVGRARLLVALQRPVAHLQVVVLPGEAQGRVRGAGRPALERHVVPLDAQLARRLLHDPRLRELVWRTDKMHYGSL